MCCFEALLRWCLPSPEASQELPPPSFFANPLYDTESPIRRAPPVRSPPRLHRTPPSPTLSPELYIQPTPTSSAASTPPAIDWESSSSDGGYIDVAATAYAAP